MRRSEQRVRDAAAARLAAGVSAFALDVEVEDVLGELRGRADVAFARQVAAYLCHTAFEMSLTRVATAFERDRSTVAHACHLIEDRRDEPHFDVWIDTLETMLRQAPAPAPAAGPTP